MSNFIKYLTNIRAQFTIKNRITKKKSYISIIIRPIIFFKNIIGLIQIFGGVNSYFYRLNFGNKYWDFRRVPNNCYHQGRSYVEEWGGHGLPKF